MSKTKDARLEVVGNPIAHSWSPQIHQAFAAQFDRTLSYEKSLVALDGFAEHASQFFASGGIGMNVTVPFKEEAFKFVEIASPTAIEAGAVNTIRIEDGVICGDNTDGIGLVNDLEQRWNCQLAEASVLILGAGGSARGLVAPMASAGVDTILCANRTVEKAEILVEKALEQGVQSCALPLPVSTAELDRVASGVDVVINTTSLGLSGDLKLDQLCEPGVISGRICYDLSYGAKAQFQRLTQAAGASSSIDGLGMLVEQAAESYFLWFGERPDTRPVYRELSVSAR